MPISFDSNTKRFHISTVNSSYIIEIFKSGYLRHNYYGKRVKSTELASNYFLEDRAFSPNPDVLDKTFSLDTLPQEYPSYGNSDYRVPAFQVQAEDGGTITDLRYKAYRIYKGKEKLEGLPSIYVEKDEEAETLEITLFDEVLKLQVILTYTVMEGFDVILRSTRFINSGESKLKLLRALSMNVDFDDADFDLIHLWGAWARERHIERKPLFAGTQIIDSKRGASSHQHNPFIALARKNADEDNGEVYGFNIVYSGNFIIDAEVDQFLNTRVNLGINPFDFSWLLEKGESFQTPEVVMVYTDKGLGDMSRTFHRLYRSRLCRGKYRDEVRPILINNWEATYFDFDPQKIEKIAITAKEMGIELFVLDDGWFGNRTDDKTSLGDWFVDKNRFPGGIEDFADRVNKQGMKFGLWFEPEMISKTSNLYSEHPDWCLHVPNRENTEGRNQLILDLSRDEVCDQIIKMVSDILKSAPISYVKWDMNRHMTEIGSAKLSIDRQRETAHRYILGLYKVMEKITTSFPDILFESCSGGGGRFDPGILYYMPQTWTSDDTDAVERLKIQYGTSLVYPPSAMGAHVSAVPNHVLERVTSLEMRGAVAMSGNFGYELDLNKLTNEEREIIKQQVALCKQIRGITEYGDFYRLKSPFEGNETSWMSVSPDKKEAVVFYFKVLGEPNVINRRLKLKGINLENNYEIVNEELSYLGDELTYVGLPIPYKTGDFTSVIWRLKAK